MKRILSIFIMLLLGMFLSQPVHAEDSAPSYQFDLSANQEHTIHAMPGDILTVTLRLKRTDSDAASQIYAVQDEIQYDPAFFRLVEGSMLLENGVESTDIALRDGSQRIYLNYLSQEGGTEWQSDTLLGTFQLEVLADAGSSILENSDYLVSTQDGADSYLADAQDLTVVVSTECTVWFESNGGSAVPEQTVVYGEPVEKPSDPQREGKQFAGWYTDLDLTQEWDFEKDTVKGNMILYAKWVQALPQESTPEPDAPPTWLWLILLLLALIIAVFIKKLRKSAKNQRKQKGQYKD